MRVTIDIEARIIARVLWPTTLIFYIFRFLDEMEFVSLTMKRVL